LVEIRNYFINNDIIEILIGYYYDNNVRLVTNVHTHIITSVNNIMTTFVLL